MRSPLTISNKGPAIRATNYWSSEWSLRGALYCSVNAGALRILLPPSMEGYLLDMQAAREVVMSRGPFPEMRRDDAIEIMFDDGSDSPFCLHLGTEQIDRVLPDSDAGSEFTCTVWVNRDGPHCALEKPCYYRRVTELPCLEPRQP